MKLSRYNNKQYSSCERHIVKRVQFGILSSEEIVANLNPLLMFLESHVSL